MSDANRKWGDDVRLLYPSKYLGAPDLAGKRPEVTIASLRVEDIDSDTGKVPKPVMRFADAGKPWIVNKTNLRRIASLHGNAATAWVGKKITLYATAVDAFGAVVEAVRAEPAKGYKYGAKDVEYAISDVGKSSRAAAQIKRGADR